MLFEGPLSGTTGSGAARVCYASGRLDEASAALAAVAIACVIILHMPKPEVVVDWVKCSSEVEVFAVCAVAVLGRPSSGAAQCKESAKVDVNRMK
jgi:hypothetical protein